MKYLYFLFLIGLCIGCNVVDQEHKQAQEGQHIDDRKNYWRARFGGKPNVSDFRKGENAIRSRLRKDVKTYRDGGIMEWEELGPSNIGGRIRAIAAHPTDDDIVLIGAAAGGVWKSTDGGDSWALKTPYYSSYPVSSIAYDPFDEDVVYACTGEYDGGGPEFPGVGVLKSDDGGDSWEKLPDILGIDTFWLSVIKMNPLKANSFLVGGCVAKAAGGARLYRTDDGGLTWDELIGVSTAVNNNSANVSDIAYDPQDTAHLIVGTNKNAFETFDSGQTWTSLYSASGIPPLDTLESGGRCEVEMTEVGGTTFITVSRNVVVMTDPINYRSELWQSVSGSGSYTSLVSLQNTKENKSQLPFGSQGQYDQVLWVNPIDEQMIIWGGLDMWKYTNGLHVRISEWQSDINGGTPTGTNSSIHADQHVITPSTNYNGVSNNKVWIGNDGGLYGSNNIWNATQHTGWFAKNEGLSITQLYGADISYNGNVALGGAQDNSSFYTNSANSSDVFTQPSTGDGGKCYVYKNNNDIFFTSTQFGKVSRSTDGGNTFCKILFLGAEETETVANGCGGNYYKYEQTDVSFIAPMELSQGNGAELFVGGSELFKSIDFGVNWMIIKDEIENQYISAIDVYDADTDILCLGYSKGNVELTTDGGDTWSVIATDLETEPANYSVTDVAINPQNSSQILVSLGMPGVPKDNPTNENLWLTTDGGNTWTDVSPNEFLHIESVAWHPLESNWIYIGTNAGILSSENKGASWNVTPLLSESSDGPLLGLITELFWQGDGSDTTPYYLCAATHGRGLWRTTFPVRKEIYVDKNCTSCGAGSFSKPFQYFENAISAAGSGSTIIFKTGGVYDEVTTSIFTNDRIKIKLLDDTVAPVVVK